MKQKITLRNLISLLPPLIFIGCGFQTNEPAPQIDISEHIKLVQSESSPGQTFRIVRAYEGQASYAEAVKGSEEPDFDALYKRHLLDPYEDECTVEQEDGDPSIFQFNPIRNLDYIMKGVNEFRNPSAEERILEALEKSASHLPSNETTVCLFVISPSEHFAKDNMMGLTGMALGANIFWLQMYPGTDWEKNLHYMVAHEYHHTVWFARHYNDEEFNLLDGIILEGKADSFAKTMYPDGFSPWTTALSDQQIEYQWNRIQEHLDSTDSLTIGRWLFGYSGVSTWTGYSLGYEIVQSYIAEHPEMTIGEWTATSPADLLAESGFDPSQSE